MVEYIINLNTVFGSLSDPTRRDILCRVAKKPMSISEISQHYELTFAAVSKHLKVLENAGLIIKHKHGKMQVVSYNPLMVNDAAEFLQDCGTIWNQRFATLETLLKKELLKK
jgi:DNA-binding transcriptional ArsR family regulator